MNNKTVLTTLGILIAALSLGFAPSIFAHTPEYKRGFSDGKTDALSSGIYDVGSSCGGYTGRECSHYIQGYHDGYNAACGSSKFVDACSGDAPGTLTH